ncbi:MAG TPA: biotin/lipoyl-containing protein [Bacteroidales bacterium]|nr:biotin/lipoyl-containing protein [Bacteroidales bacterium]
MKTEIQINNRTVEAELLQREGSKVKISVDGKVFDLDLVKINEGIYSAVYNGNSYNFEMVTTNSKRHYTVKTFYDSYDVEIIDQQTKYLKSRSGAGQEAAGNTIVSPMPGKVVKILVKEGDEVEAGQTVLIISAMKMESEYKAPRNSIVKKITVADGDVVDSNQIVMVFE